MNGSEKVKVPFLQLERYVWVLAVVWTIVIATSLVWHVVKTKQETLEEAQIQARTAYEKDVTYRRWNAGHGGVYVPVTEKTQPNPHLSDVPERDITTPSGKALTLMNPAYMTRQAHELEKQKLGVRGHITSLNPIRPENTPDSWETEALRTFERGKTEISSAEKLEGKEYMRLMRPLITEKGCLKCHAKQGYHEGDIRGGISVSIPMEPFLAIERRHILTFALVYGLLWMVGLSGIGLAMQQLIRTERERKRAEEALQKAHVELERKVEERTAELANANLLLKQEITERKQAEEALKLNESRLEILLKLNQMTDASLQEITNFALEEGIRLTGSKVGYLSFLNEDETVLTMYSWSKIAMEECSISDKPIVYPVESTGLWGEAVRQRRPIITNDYTAPNPWKKGYPEGHVQLTRHMNVPIFDGDRIVIVTGVGNKSSDYDESDVRQVTLLMQGMWRIIQRKKAEEELRSEKTFTENALNSLSDIFFVFDLNGKFLRWNKTMNAVTGYSDTEISSMQPADFFLKEDIQQVMNAIKMVVKDGHAGVEATVVTRDRRHTLYEFTGTLLRNYEGEPIGFCGVGRDITKRKKAEEKIKEYTENLEEKVIERTRELEDANLELQVLNKEIDLRRQEAETSKLQAMEASRAKSDFLANMSHELRTPLNAIIGFSDMMFQGMTGKLTEQQHDYLGDIRESGEILLSLINDILDLSKVEAGKTELELSEFNLKELIERSLVMFKEKAMKHNIKVKYEVDERIVSVTADERRLKQVMFNLLSNAFKFTPDGGSVRVKARLVNSEQYLVNSKKLFTDDYSLTTNRDFIEISVEDTGIGIRPEDFDKLFQPFQQLEYTLTKKYEGTGLGLTLCKKIVELHNGRIWVESEVGKGSKFTFVIPAKQKT